MKHNTFIRALTLLLSAMLLVSSALTLTACGNGEQTDGETSGTDVETVPEADTEGPDETLDVPDLDFQQFVFHIYCDNDPIFYEMMDVEDGYTGDAVMDAIYERNRIIENRFNFTFDVEAGSWGNSYAILQNQVHAGYSDGESYELIQLVQREAYNAAISGLLYNINKMEYIDTDKEYYFRHVNEQCCFGGYPFFAYGADSINLMAWTVGLVYNKRIAADLGIENLYDAVRGNTWTHEKLFTLADNAASDLDGDGKIKSNTDRMGLVGVLNRTVSTLWECSGEFLIVKDEDEMPVYNASSSERLINIMTNALNRMDSDAYDVFDTVDKIDIFMDGRSLFFSPIIGQLNTIRSMEEDYGLLPYPKYDENQAEYISRSGEGFIPCVPATCQDTERTSAVMQSLAYYSYKTVYNAYYEQALSAKFLRDPDSVEMLKLILATLTVDIGDSIWFDAISTPILAGIASKKSQTGLGSLFKKYERAAENQIKKAAKFLETVER